MTVDGTEKEPALSSTLLSLTYFRIRNASALWKVLSDEWWYTFPMSISTAYTTVKPSLYEGRCKWGMVFLMDLAIEILKILFY